MTRLDEQLWQAGEVIGSHGECELPADLGQSAVTPLAQPGHCPGPAEGFFHAFANALGDGIAGIADGVAIDRRTTPALVLCHMRVTALSRSSMRKSLVS